MRTVVAVCLVVSAASAHAQPSPWTRVFESPESTIYLARDAKAEPGDRSGDGEHIWFLADRKIALMMGLLNMTTYSSLVQRWEVDCKTRAYRVTGGAYFADKMGEGKPLRNVLEREGFEIAPNNPQMNAVMYAACTKSGLKTMTHAQREALAAKR